MAFIEPMHRNKPNITYLLTRQNIVKIHPRKWRLWLNGTVTTTIYFMAAAFIRGEIHRFKVSKLRLPEWRLTTAGRPTGESTFRS